jgi:hypothetical protein
MRLIDLLIIINLLICLAGWLLYLRERRRHQLAKTAITRWQKAFAEWKRTAEVWQESATIWKEAATIWRETAEGYQRSSENWRELYLQQDDTNDDGELIN